MFPKVCNINLAFGLWTPKDPIYYSSKNLEIKDKI